MGSVEIVIDHSAFRSDVEHPTSRPGNRGHRQHSSKGDVAEIFRSEPRVHEATNDGTDPVRPDQQIESMLRTVREAKPGTVGVLAGLGHFGSSSNHGFRHPLGERVVRRAPTGDPLAHSAVPDHPAIAVEHPAERDGVADLHLQSIRDRGVHGDARPPIVEGGSRPLEDFDLMPVFKEDAGGREPTDASPHDADPKALGHDFQSPGDHCE